MNLHLQIKGTASSTRHHDETPRKKRGSRLNQCNECMAAWKRQNPSSKDTPSSFLRNSTSDTSHIDFYRYPIHWSRNQCKSLRNKNFHQDLNRLPRMINFSPSSGPSIMPSSTVLCIWLSEEGRKGSSTNEFSTHKPIHWEYLHHTTNPNLGNVSSTTEIPPSSYDHKRQMREPKVGTERSLPLFSLPLHMQDKERVYLHGYENGKYEKSELIDVHACT